MEEEKCTVALEVSNSKIAALACVPHGIKGIKIVGFSERQITPKDEVMSFGNVINGQVASELISEVISELASGIESKEFEFELDALNINIANREIVSKKQRIQTLTSGDSTKVEQGDMDNLVDDAIKANQAAPGNSVLHCLPREFYVNESIATEKIVGKFGGNISGEFNIFTTKSENIQRLVECVNATYTKGKANTVSNYIKVDNIVVNGIADSFSLLYDKDDKREGVAVVNIGAELTDISIYLNNTLRYHKIIPIGGNTINKDLESTFGIYFQDAEQIKVLCGSIPKLSFEASPVLLIERKNGLQPIEVFFNNAQKVVESRLKEMAALITAEISLSGYKKNITNGIILTGGTTMYEGIEHLFTKVSGIKSIRRANYGSKVFFKDFEMLDNPKYSTLLGLAFASNIPYDERVSARVITPKAISNKAPIVPKSHVAAAPSQEKKSKWSWSYVTNVLQNGGRLNDDYYHSDEK